MGNRKYKMKKVKIGIYDDIFNSYVFNECPSNMKCLDVGCWTGKLGELLIKEKRCSVDGIDINKKALAIARERGYGMTYCLNLNNPEEVRRLESNINKKYDCIICADVLEHLVNPLLVLKQLKKLLKRRGMIIISVPNVAFISYRLLHLFGRFDYNSNGGVMDVTHLRFFTNKTIKKISEDAGYRVVKIYGYNQVRRLYFFLKLLGKIIPSLFALQILVILMKNGK
jgi:2-polyprenyl-3-methyl-5-hydroxy-6-metoxy-1,4-benzoquinol methylase